MGCWKCEHLFFTNCKYKYGLILKSNCTHAIDAYFIRTICVEYPLTYQYSMLTRWLLVFWYVYRQDTAHSACCSSSTCSVDNLCKVLYHCYCTSTFHSQLYNTQGMLVKTVFPSLSDMLSERRGRLNKIYMTENDS